MTYFLQRQLVVLALFVRWLFSNPGICVVGDTSPKHREIRTDEVFGNVNLFSRINIKL